MTTGARELAGLARSLAIYRGRPWKMRALARLYERFLDPGDLAFDIGAHVGNRTRAMLRAGARVVALEPQPLFHAFLARDLPAATVLLNAAAGPRDGLSRLAISRLHPTVTSLAPGFAETMETTPGFRHVRWDAEASVRVITLDALIADHGRPRFIKIDVEGFEDEVLRGLGQPVDWIAFETLPALPRVTRDAVLRLAALGRYRFNFIPGEGGDFAFGHWTDAPGILAALSGDDETGDIYARNSDAPLRDADAARRR